MVSRLTVNQFFQVRILAFPQKKFGSYKIIIIFAGRGREDGHPAGLITQRPLVRIQFSLLKQIEMSLLTIFLVLIIVGLLLYLVNRYIPMDANIKSILNIVVIIVIVLWLLKALGVFTFLGNVHL